MIPSILTFFHKCPVCETGHNTFFSRHTVSMTDICADARKTFKCPEGYNRRFGGKDSVCQPRCEKKPTRDGVVVSGMIATSLMCLSCIACLIKTWTSFSSGNTAGGAMTIVMSFLCVLCLSSMSNSMSTLGVASVARSFGAEPTFGDLVQMFFRLPFLM